MLLGEAFGIDGVIVVVVVAALFFGSKAIPKFAKNLGSAKSEFEKGLKESTKPDAAPGTGATPPASTPNDSDTAS